MNLTVVGCSPAWPNPGGAQSGYLVNGFNYSRGYNGVRDSANTGSVEILK